MARAISTDVEARVEIGYSIEGVEYRWYEKPFTKGQAGPWWHLFQVAVACILGTPLLIVFASVYACVSHIWNRYCKCCHCSRKVMQTGPDTSELVPVAKRQKRKLRLKLKARIEDFWCVKDFDYEVIEFKPKELKPSHCMLIAANHDCIVKVPLVCSRAEVKDCTNTKLRCAGYTDTLNVTGCHGCELYVSQELPPEVNFVRCTNTSIHLT